MRREVPVSLSFASNTSGRETRRAMRVELKKRKEKMKMTRRILAMLMALVMVFALAACGSESGGDSGEEVLSADELKAQVDEIIAGLTVPENIDPATVQGVEDGVLTIAMECAYAPYNWTQIDDSNGAVPISTASGSYANGYDVMISQIICNIYGWELEIAASAWDSLTPGVQSGIYDANIAGQSMTADRMEQVDMAGPYYYADIVVVTTADGEYADAQGIADLAGGTATAQSGTIWYDSCLPQIPDVELEPPAETAPQMIMSLTTGQVDYICTDIPTATAAVRNNDGLKILNFAGTDGDFQFATEEERAENVNIGISVQKGNETLRDAMNAVLEQMDADDFNTIMNYAIAIQPEI